MEKQVGLRATNKLRKIKKMEFEKLICTRRSVHFFEKGFCVSDQEFEKIIELTRWTPSGYNAQPWHFGLVRDRGNLEKISEIAFGQSQIVDAGAAVVLTGDLDFLENERERILAEFQSVRGLDANQKRNLEKTLQKPRPVSQREKMIIRAGSMAAMSFLLAAENLGLASGPIMGFDQKKLAAFFALPPNQIPILLIALGKKDLQIPENKWPRKPAKQLFSFEKWGAR